MNRPSSPPSEPRPPQRNDSVLPVAVLLLVLSAAAIFAAGLSLGSSAGGRDAAERAAMEAFIETYRRINDDYLGEAQPDELLEGAIRGMIETLDDPYSAYLGPDDFESTFDEISGRFEGIGARMDTQASDGASCPRIETGCLLRVVEILPDTPALAAGLRVDDVVTAVDGRSLEGQTIEDAVRLIRGPRESLVTLALTRDGQSLELPITRGLIASQDVRSALLADGQVGYLRIDGFSSGAGDAFETALGEQLAEGVRRLVVDVRADPGGLVDAAVEITSQFLADGPVYWEEDAQGRQHAVRVQGGGLATDPAIEVAVLVDSGTASASEILAGALQDAGRARLVGERTFGKGTVQEWTQLPGQSGGLRLSVAKWLTRDLEWVQDVGLRPDVEVAAGERFWPVSDDDAVQAAALAADAQLQHAVNMLLAVEAPAATAPPG